MPKLQLVYCPSPWRTCLTTTHSPTTSSAPPLAAAVPRARDRWGCPFWPLVVLGTAQSACPILPPGSELRGKIAEILRKSIKPELKNGPATLLKRMDEIREAGA